MTSLHLFDLLVIGGYFLILLGIGYWAAKREKNVSADYFLASRDVGWFAVGASLFASNIGSEHLVGLAGTGAASGMAVGHFEWLACLILLTGTAIPSMPARFRSQPRLQGCSCSNAASADQGPLQTTRSLRRLIDP